MLAVARSDEGGRLGADAPTEVKDGTQRPASPQRFVDANGVPRRVPKPGVRNGTSDGSGSSGVRTGSSMADTRSIGGSSRPPSSRSSQHISTPNSTRSLSDEAPTRQSLASRDGAKSSKQPTKKKKGGVLGFLTLKEPSTSAWADFAEAEKQKARQKGINTASTGLPGVSSQKLPEHVPKVNSKWDGLPDSAKRKSLESKATSRNHGDSTFSTSTRQSTWTARTSTSIGSNQAKKAFNSPLQSPRSPRFPNAPWSPDDWRVSSSGSSTQAPALAMDPRSLGPPIEETEENRPQTFLLPPSPEGHGKIALPDLNEVLSPLSPLTPPELDTDEVQYLQELDARKSQDWVPEAPATPPADVESQPALVGIHYPELDSPGTDSRNASPDFLFHADMEQKVNGVFPPLQEPKRQAINFSRPRSMTPGTPRSDNFPSLNIDEVASRATPVEGVPLSPTLKDDVGRIEPFLTDTFASHSRETGHIPQRVASTLDPSTRYTNTQPAAENTEDASDEDDDSDHSPYPDEPDFSVSSLRDSQDTTSTQPGTVDHDPDAGLARSGSQVSLAPSIAPSTMSERWYLSPKERLGLGSRVRKSEVLPWEIAENTPDTEISNRASPPLPENKRKRLSLRLSSKR